MAREAGCDRPLAEDAVSWEGIVADTPNLDPTSLWRDMLAQWESGLASLTSQASGTTEMSLAMQQMTALSLRMQEATAEMVAKSLQALNLPSRTELLGLHDRLDRIEATLERLAPKAAPKDQS